jgi:yeast amino acid transporter
MGYLTLPVIMLFWAVAYMMKRQGFHKLAEIDLDAGTREHDWEAINAERAIMAVWPWWRHGLNLMW